MTGTKELFIVEGESAASTVRQAMDKQSQCVLAVQGKFINVTKASSAKVIANLECQKIFQSLACGFGDECDPNKLQFSRILILADSDVDGAHSRALLLSFFDRYLRPLVDTGLVSVILPPLFRIVGKHLEHKLYAWDEQEREHLVDKKGLNKGVEITRFKGVAQFTSIECAQLFLQPETRKQVNLGSYIE
jgi:DNA gyrase subunit B